MANYSTEGRTAKVISPKSGVVFAFKKLTAKEFLSKPYEIELEVVTTEGGLSFKDFGGQKMGVEFTTVENCTRLIHGYVIEMSQMTSSLQERQDQYFRYHVKLAPWPWFLSRRADCRIFNSKDGGTPNSVLDILKKVFTDAKFSSDYDQRSLSETYPSLNYVVQYNETDLNFASRMMEREGIYYYFEHENSAHKMVLADGPSGHNARDGYEEIPFREEHEAVSTESVSKWVHKHAVRTGEMVHRDYDPTDPAKNLEKKYPDPQDCAQSKHEWYEYPGQYVEPGEGTRLVKGRLAERQFGGEMVEGVGNSLGLAVGYNFKLVEHPLTAENAEYTVVSSEIMAQSSDTASEAAGDMVLCDKFEVKFKAIPKTLRYHPPRATPVPRAVGPHTAVVVGQKGEEITTDEFGRVKVQFHWDRVGKNDQDSSCWVRVSQNWAHGSWGSQVIPRHGMEVIVEYIDSDLEKPIVTGCVYNGKNKPPFDLPGNATQTGMKSRSSKEGSADNFNEIRLEDKKDEELFFIQAEKDAERIVKNNDVQKIGLETSDPGDQTIEIHNDRTVTLNEGNESFTVKKGDQTVKVETGSQTIDVKKTILIKAGDEIKLESGQSSITLKKDGTITIKGKDVKITATAGFEAKGMTAKVSGTTSTFEGSGSCDVKGGMVNIN